jgi:signal transduction histidine kinase
LPRPALRIALIEPEPARAAELGQLLSDALVDCAVELSDTPGANLILIDVTAPRTPPSLFIPTIRFGRSPDGSYRAYALRPGGTDAELPILSPMPLTDSIRCAALMWNALAARSLSAEDGKSADDQSARLHQRLLQLQKLEAVGELAGGIAHDFNNLLLVIRSYSEMLLEESDLPSTVRHHAQEILTASRRAGDLTREHLAFSRRQPLQLKPTNLNGVIDSAVPMLSRLVGKGITVWVQLLPDLWPVQADTAQLEQVLVNLAANARDAMPNGGKLLLETTNVAIEDKHAAMPPGDYVLLAVSDTGLGIPRHILPRIFEPFFTTKERGKGTGLGLASVYGIVKQSGGYIWAYSESGYGTTFKIYMPRATAAKLTTEEPIARLAARHATNSAS